MRDAETELRAVRLSSLAKTAPRPLAKLLADLADKLTGERLDGPRQHRGHTELTLRGKWPPRRLTVAPGPSLPIPIEVPIWLRRTSRWLVVFEASRALSDAAAFMVASVFAGDPAQVAALQLQPDHWKRLDGWVNSGREKGLLLGGKFYKAAPLGCDVDWIALRSSAESGARLVRESFQSARGIGEMLIRTPAIEAANGSLTCRIGGGGGVRIYGAEVTDAMVDALLFELEQIWSDVVTGAGSR
ncbi:MAG: hypothetical protein WD749_08750 [Phycisphaerales bacterium]